MKLCGQINGRAAFVPREKATSTHRIRALMGPTAFPATELETRKISATTQIRIQGVRPAAVILTD